MTSDLPPALRIFLLTLAVVHDLLAITIIAAFCTTGTAVVPLLLSLIPLALFAAAVQRGVRALWVLLPLGMATSALVHASGIPPSPGSCSGSWPPSSPLPEPGQSRDRNRGTATA